MVEELGIRPPQNKQNAPYSFFFQFTHPNAAQSLKQSVVLSGHPAAVHAEDLDHQECS